MAPININLPSYDELLHIFQSVDSNHTGQITASELQVALSKGSWKSFNKKTVDILLGLVDRNHSKTVTFDEFGELYKYIVGWYNCFKSFDRDGSDGLDRKELHIALTKLGFVVSSHEIVDHLDEHNVGDCLKDQLSFDDFVEVCVKVAMKRGRCIKDKIVA